MAKVKGGMMLDESDTEQFSAATVAPGSPAATDTGRPFCERHNCLMIANGTKDQVTYYRCPVPGCDCREKRARQTTPIPARPMTCAMASCTQGDERQYLAVVSERSTIAQLCMACPKCKNAVYVTRPTYGATAKAALRRPADASFDER